LYQIITAHLYAGKRRYTLDQIEREEFTEETESERPESEPEVGLEVGQQTFGRSRSWRANLR
jgi:hypothetical protein